MKIYTKLTAIAAASMLAMASQTAWAAGDVASDNAGASATIITPITLTKDTDMDFAEVIATAEGGTVVLTASATPSLTATGVSAGQGGAAAAAKFTVGGQTGYTYAISFPAPTATLTHSGGSATMTVNNFTASFADNITTLGGHTLSATAASNAFYVGGTLNVGPDQLAGTYTGTVSVSANYE